MLILVNKMPLVVTGKGYGVTPKMIENLPSRVMIPRHFIGTSGASVRTNRISWNINSEWYTTLKRREEL